MSEKKKDTAIKTKVGGQALIEGVMMLGPDKGCMAVRQPDREIYTEVWERKKPKWYNKAPFIRGCINFVSQMADGYKYLMKSGEISGMFDEEEEEKDKKKAQNPEKSEKKDKEEKTSVLDGMLMVISMILGIGLAVGLFVMLPTFIFTGIQYLFGDTDISAFRSLVEGVLKIAIFIFYLWLTSKMKTMKRLYQYHGAEHKTIFCYEHGEELTVENVRKYRRFHPRCGTSFIFLTLAISILVYTLLPINSELFMNTFGVSQFIGDLLRICCKIIFLPLVVGISYELIKIAGGCDNVFTKILSAPGLAIQRLTTKEPEDEMIEVAIASMKPVLPDRPEDALW